MQPFPAPTGDMPVSANVEAAGLPIPPIKLERIFSDSQWEFVLEWADSLCNLHSTVERGGRAREMGRDIIAFDKVDPVIWDNYKFRHYKSGLTPCDILVKPRAGFAFIAKNV